MLIAFENPLNESPLAFPILECMHIVGFAIAVGTIALVDFRLLGFGMLRQSAGDLAKAFSDLAGTLADNEATINEELLAVQGSPADIGGYYRPDDAKAADVMRPSSTFNDALATLSS